jgi:hypothetical protein
LVQWWNQSTWAQNNNTSAQQQGAIREVAHKLANRFQRSHRVLGETKAPRNGRFCSNGDVGRFYYQTQYAKCIKPDIHEADTMARHAVYGAKDDNVTSDNYKYQHDHWASVFASLPVLRVTMLREPFSWLTSRFFWKKWHLDKEEKGYFAPWRDQIETREVESYLQHLKPDLLEFYHSLPTVRCDDIEQLVSGWGKQYALEFLVYFCGEHCMGQLAAINEAYSYDTGKLRKEKQKYLKVMARQAVYNMRNSFAVVGLLQQTQDFYDMISNRVDYMDMSLNPTVEGDPHFSGYAKEWTRCKDRFQGPDFQRKVLIASPEIAAAVGVYKAGVEVYEFQKREMEECKAAG